VWVSGQTTRALTQATRGRTLGSANDGRVLPPEVGHELDLVVVVLASRSRLGRVPGGTFEPLLDAGPEGDEVVEDLAHGDEQRHVAIRARADKIEEAAKELNVGGEEVLDGVTDREGGEAEEGAQEG
jgi:hypothetical protein